jgi:hypothetical protein
MIAYWERDCEWMSEELLAAICPSFTGHTGPQLLDVSSRGFHCQTLNIDRNTSWQTSGGKLAFLHDGIDDRVFNNSFPMSEMSNQNNSVSSWINPTTTNTNTRFFGLGQFGVSFGLRFNFQNLEFLFGGTAALSVAMTSATYANRWTHVCGVADASGARLFFDGVQVGTRSDTVSLSKTNGLGIGYRFGINSDFYSGFTDDFRIYSRTLTPPEIRKMYERDRGGGMLHQPPSRRSYYAQLAAAFAILAESGSYVLSGQPIPLLYGRVLPADTGSVLLSGQTTSLLTSRLLNADQGSYACFGTDAATLLGRLLDAGAAAYTLDGNAAGFIASRRISADTVAYLASGLDAGFLRSRVLEAGTGQYVLVASPVNLQTNTPGTGGVAPYYYLFLLGGSR